MEWIHINGINRGTVQLYALSTCGHCKRTKDLLNEMGIDYSYIFVDTLAPDDINEVMQTVEKFNPRGSFPTLVIDNGKTCIVGYHEDQIREALS